MEKSEESPLPPPPEDKYSRPDDCRIWIGNLDTRITEFSLLKLLQKYGDLKNYEFLYHKTGPDKGKPRGYCFATYTKPQEAQLAQAKLNGKLALSRRLVVKEAHAPVEDAHRMKSGPAEKAAPPPSTSDQIAAIEAKLEDIEKGKGTSHIIAQQYIQQAKQREENKRTHRPRRKQKRSR